MSKLKVGGAADRISDTKLVKVEPGTVSLSTPIVSAQDGPRMTAFAGKKAPPFGSKERKTLGVKKAIAKRLIAKKKAGVSLSVSGHRVDIELGKDGAEWKHGYIPENAAAVALKEHRKPGSKAKPLSPAQTRAKKAAGPVVKSNPSKHFTSADERKSMSQKALKEHIAAHTAAKARAKSEQSKALHDNEARLAKRELVRRKAATTRAKNAAHPKKVNPIADPEGTAPLGNLDFKEIHKRLADPSVSTEDKIVIKAEIQRRRAEAESILTQGKEALKAARKELGEDNLADPEVAGRVFSAIYKHFPAIKPHLEKLRTSRVGQAIHGGLGLESLLNNAMNGLMVPLVGAAVTSVLLR